MVKRMLNERASTVDKGLLASYDISKLIAIADKPHDIATVDTELQDDDLLVYVEHLNYLYGNMQVRFSDLLDMNILDWLVDPFRMNAVDVNITLQEYLIQPQSDITAQARFKRDKHYFWISSEITHEFPQLFEKAKLYFIAFPTSYLIDSGFNSQLTYLLSKYIAALML
ncbi:zinc finger MYM-type protein 6-like [Tachypleus tridentatus]|uniref:zinc finger MYM-type protein 6-like n=1 Tax=Tachypleus tridentatus TaxID=6853 RepID=UPI003FD5EDD1